MQERPPQAALVTLGLTTAALVAFAANSILCRLALGTGAVDPWSFTSLRLGTGALTLLVVTAGRGRATKRARQHAMRGDWLRAGYLALYALPFSLAYVDLDAGTGALLLFGAVQLTMIALGIVAGERPGALEWLALIGAAAGMVYFVLPGISAPDPLGAALMVAAGVGWGCYSIAGKGAADPATATSDAFWRSALVVIAVSGLAFPSLAVTAVGAVLATISGALTSGIGYVIWYAALRGLSATRAALVQLSVPVLAAGAGVLFLGEAATIRLSVASVVILGSVALGIVARQRQIGPARRPAREQ